MMEYLADRSISGRKKRRIQSMKRKSSPSCASSAFNRRAPYHRITAMVRLVAKSTDENSDAS